MTQNCSCHGAEAKHSQTVAAVLERPRYSAGLILEDSDLTAAVDYTRSLNRLLFRNLFGCGVVCGLTVSVKKDCGVEIGIAPGLALDGCGDPVQLPRAITIALDDAKLKAFDTALAAGQEPSLWVILCGREKTCAPRSLVCDSDEYDAVTQPTRIRALAEVSLAFERPTCVCECERTPGAAAQPDMASDMAATPGTAIEHDGCDCHYQHEHRVECAPDCGCGTACDCGCCVLLARVDYRRPQQGQGQAGQWQVQHRGVRRFVRPRLICDPADPEQASAQATAHQCALFYQGAVDDSQIHEAVQALHLDVQPGQCFSHEQAMAVLDWASHPPAPVRRRAEAMPAAAPETGAGAAADAGGAAQPAAARAGIAGTGKAASAKRNRRTGAAGKDKKAPQ